VNASHETQLWLFAVGVLAFGVWTLHFALAYRAWRRERSARSFQIAYIGGMIEALFVSIILGRASRLWPDQRWIEVIALFAAPILAWMLLSGGVIALWTWSRPERRW